MPRTKKDTNKPVERRTPYLQAAAGFGALDEDGMILGPAPGYDAALHLAPKQREFRHEADYYDWAASQDETRAAEFAASAKAKRERAGTLRELGDDPKTRAERLELLRLRKRTEELERRIAQGAQQ